MLRDRCTVEQYELFLKRAGTNPHNDHRPKKNSILWTKGGCWRKESPFTQLLVLHQSLPLRPLRFPWQQKLGHTGIALIEKELMHAINPDAVLRGDCIQQAIDYVRWRIPNYLGYKSKKKEMAAAVWFFQTALPFRDQTMLVPKGNGGYIVQRMFRKTYRKTLKSWEF